MYDYMNQWLFVIRRENGRETQERERDAPGTDKVLPSKRFATDCTVSSGGPTSGEECSSSEQSGF